MKVRIEKTFTDKHTGERREAGSIVEFDDERAAELLADPRQVVSEVKEKGQEPKKAATKPKAAPKKKPKPTEPTRPAAAPAPIPPRPAETKPPAAEKRASKLKMSGEFREESLPDTPNEATFCPHCGASQPKGTAFCGRCGKKMT
jgi:hypothetical protein